MYVHPNSGCMLDMAGSGNVILASDDTVSKLSADGSGFTAPGILMHLGALFGMVRLIRKAVC